LGEGTIDDVEKCDCSAKKRFGAKSEPPCKVCSACQNEKKDECTLYPAYRPNCCGKLGKTPHHLVPVHCFMEPGERKAAKRASRKPQVYKGCEKYDEKDAPCICVTKGGKNAGDHEDIHNSYDAKEDAHKNRKWSYNQASNDAAESANEVFGCDEKCIKAQLDAYHKDQCRIKGNQPLRADSGGKKASPGIPLSNTSAGDQDG